MKVKYLFLAAVATALTSAAQAQVKIGDNPSSLSSGTVLDVEKSGKHVVVTNTGRVGVGLTNPAYDIQISGQNMGIINPTTAASFLELTNTGTVTRLQQNVGAGFVGNLTPDNFEVYTNNTPRITVDKYGPVGVANITPELALDVRSGFTNTTYAARFNGLSSRAVQMNVVNGNNVLLNFTAGSDQHDVGNVYTNGATVLFQSSSDVRLKENIAPTHYGLADIMKIGVKDYIYKNDKSHTPMTGFLAQDLYKVFPSVVVKGGEDPNKNPWTVDYGKLTPLLVKAVQEQQAQINALKKENAAMKVVAARSKASQRSYAQLSKQVKDMQELLGINTNAKATKKAVVMK